MADSPTRGEMPFLDHLEELRWRLLRSLVAVLIGALAGWGIVNHFDVLGLLMAPIGPLLPTGQLMVTGPAEAFFITLKLAVAVGVVLASPVVIYQTWAFLAPALYDRERRVLIPSLVVGLLLFCVGAAAAYFLVLPRALSVLLSFQRGHLAPIITAEKYFGFAVPLILAFGAITELPLVMVILAGFGLVTSPFLARNRRYALVIAALVAAFLAPPDALSMVVMMVPMVALYEVSIWCVWVVGRRRARRLAAEAAQAGGRAAGMIVLLVVLGAGSLLAQRPIPVTHDTTHQAGVPGSPGAPGAPVQGHAIDTATARRLGLPTAPTRAFPPTDALMDSLLTRKGYRITHYTADSLVMHQGQQGNELELKHEALVDQDGSKLQADSIHYVQTACRLDANGAPSLFGDNSVMIGDSLKYDNCLKRGVISNALTSFHQGGATWFMRGDMAVDSGSTRMFGASSSITSSDLPVPDYHFQAGEVKWLNKNVMVARPAVLYIRDVPLMWLPFIFQDIRLGRRSGVLVPSFGLNDLVRPTRSYQRHIRNLGYYWVPNDYVDLLGSVDWYSNRYVEVHGGLRYRWLNQFVNGALTYAKQSNLDGSGTSTQLSWNHQQSFDSRTQLNASVNYATSASVIQQNTVDPFLSLAQLSSQANFQRQFDWGTVNLGGSRSQNLSTALVTQTFPQFSLTPSPINITSFITWSPGFSYTNSQSFHNLSGTLLTPLLTGVDTVEQFFNDRQTAFSFQTPFRFGSWTLSNSVSISDVASNERHEYFVEDPTDSALHRILYARTFQTTADWQVSFGLPPLFTNSWKLQPSVSILNSTSLGPYEIRNQFTGGDFVHQGKRLGFGATLSPTFFGFFPGFGPLDRIRHSVQLLVQYLYAPGSTVSDAFAHAVDPSGLNRAAKSDPQQTVSVGISQNFEAKLKPPPGDTTGQGKKIKLLSISTSSIEYNFERSKLDPTYNGWQTQTLTNTFASDLVPGFSLSLTHDLWNGPVGLRSSNFSPFLTNVSAGFSISGATIRGIGSLLGLVAKAPPPKTPASPTPADAGLAGGTPGVPNPIGGGVLPPSYGGIRGMAGSPYANPGAGGGGTGFSLNLSFTSTRTRPIKDSTAFIQVQTDSQYQLPNPTLVTPGLLPTGVGTEQMNINLHFSPTPHWDLGWTTTYDFHTHQFAQHYLQLERDLRRWHAAFAFAKSPNGNLAFNFTISLRDEQDIKFDYDQNSFRQ